MFLSLSLRWSKSPKNADSSFFLSKYKLKSLDNRRPDILPWARILEHFDCKKNSPFFALTVSLRGTPDSPKISKRAFIVDFSRVQNPHFSVAKSLSFFIGVPAKNFTYALEEFYWIWKFLFFCLDFLVV